MDNIISTNSEETNQTKKQGVYFKLTKILSAPFLSAILGAILGIIINILTNPSSSNSYLWAVLSLFISSIFIIKIINLNEIFIKSFSYKNDSNNLKRADPKANGKIYTSDELWDNAINDESEQFKNSFFYSLFGGILSIVIAVVIVICINTQMRNRETDQNKKNESLYISQEKINIGLVEAINSNLFMQKENLFLKNKNNRLLEILNRKKRNKDILQLQKIK
jgi:hypothetical protein